MNINLLSGADLLRKGVEKTERCLPVQGAKDVTPTGSWIEQKQIQAALEARKQLLEDERVEKWGFLSHAEWDSEKRLACVTEKRGGHWNYLGHCVGKQLYLYPEEALFLMEVNCLELKFRGIQVSLQQAYSLLLTGTINVLEYKVYSELSRVGYRVLRTTIKSFEDSSEKENDSTTEVNQEDKVQKVQKDEEEKQNKSHTENEKLNIVVCEETVSNKEKQEHFNNDMEELITKDNGETEEIVKNKCINGCDDGKTTNVYEETIMNNAESVKERDVIEVDSDKEKVVEIDNEKEIVNKKTERNIEAENCNRTEDSMDSDDVMCVEYKLQNGEDVESNSTLKEHSASDNTKDWRTFPIIMVMGPTLAYTENVRETESVNPIKKQMRFSNSKKIMQPCSKFMKIHRYRSRSKLLSSLQLPNSFECIPNFSGKETVTVAAPEEQYLPRNVFLNKTHYLLKIEDITSKQRSQPAASVQRDLAHTLPNNHQAPIRDDPLHEAFLRQQFLRSIFCQIPRFPFMTFPDYQRRNQRFGYYPRNNVHRNFFIPPFQRFLNYPYRYNLPPQPTYNVENENFNNFGAEQTPRKITVDTSKKLEHLQAIRRLACRLRKFQKDGGARNSEYKNSLRKLIVAYNTRYKENLQLSESFILLNDCNNTDTVDLDEEEHSSGKRRKQRNGPSEPGNSDKDVLLAKIKEMASCLKQLRVSGERCFRNRRSLLDAIKIFNRKFNARIHLNCNFEIKDSEQIVLDSSSDSDCMITDESIQKNESFTSAKRRRLSSSKESERTPHDSVASTSKDEAVDAFHDASMRARDFYHRRSELFSKWLPSIEDWGRAEVVPAVFCHHRIISSGQELYVYNYLNGYKDFRDWGELKSEFWDTLERNTMDVEEDVPQSASEVPSCAIEPLLGPEDCTDLVTALQKVRIIKTHTHTEEEVATELKVTFDVYERDVKNFRKTDLPIPAFRLICLDERSAMPDVSEVGGLQQRYRDSAPVVLAVVGATVSYLQMMVSDLPVHIKKRFI